jgi:peptide/nickel transport system substrate-binding protein
MDALSSQANLAGYLSVIIAAERLNKILPMMMTPAGTIAASQVFIIGAGVAGLQAIATAKRLGVQDLAEARRLLAELGWKPDGAGMLLRDGEPFRLRLITYADRPELSAIATAIQAQLAEIGVAAEVEITNSSAIPSGHQDGSLEMALIARNFGVIADPLGVMQLDLGTAGSDWGAMNWQHPEVHRLLDELSVESGWDEYRRKAQHIAGLLASELPLIPITFYTEQIAVNRRLKGFRFDPFERSYHISELELAH